MQGIFEALGEPVRRHILELLAVGEQSAGTVVGALQREAAISQPAVSQHLKVLREAGLVTVRRQGTRRLYAVDPAGVDVFAPWIGTTGGLELKLGEARAIPLTELKAAHEGWFPRFMDS